MLSHAAPRRLDPCPCGSGRRYKDCHGRLSHEPDPARAEAAACNDEGLLRLDQRDIEGAKARFRRAIELSPQYPQAHFNLSLALLLEGDYANGWREYEWRTRAPGYADYARFAFGMPRWQGEDPRGRRILVHAEQGIGDTIQFARFLPRLAAGGAAVEVFCQPQLAGLLARLEGVRSAVSDLAQRPRADFHAPIVDVGAHFLPTPKAPHWHGSYVSARPERIERWSKEIGALPRPRAGLAWKGSAKNVADRKRSLAPELMTRLAAADASLVSLQVGEPPLPLAAGRVHDAGARIADWDDTAAIVASLDVVVTVDTALAHLAGAMGAPVWTLLRREPEWRWGLEGQTTKWYPSMRLYRQERFGEWQPVIERVLADLAGLRHGLRA